MTALTNAEIEAIRQRISPANGNEDAQALLAYLDLLIEGTEYIGDRLRDAAAVGAKDCRGCFIVRSLIEKPPPHGN